MRESALMVYEAIFSNKPSITIEGVEYFMEKTTRTDLRFFNIQEYSFLEQNPEKSSNFGELAREGSQIMWVMRGRRYLGQVRNGDFHDFRKKKEK